MKLLLITAFSTVLSAQQNPAGEALDAVRALRSVTTASITYREYAPRVLDARVKVDHALLNEIDPELRASVLAALRTFEIASTVWNQSIGRLNRPVDPMTMRQILNSDLGLCAAVQAKAKRWKSVWHAPYPPELVSTIWTCADSQVARAEAAAK